MKKIIIISAAVLLAFTAFSFTSCEVTITDYVDILAAPQGYVYDGRTGDPIANVGVQLRNSSGTAVKTATTTSTGYYTFSDVEFATFELTASDTAGDYSDERYTVMYEVLQETRFDPFSYFYSPIILSLLIDKLERKNNSEISYTMVKLIDRLDEFVQKLSIED